MLEHWVLQAGLRDAVPDLTKVTLSRSEAVDLATGIFDLSDLEQTRLTLFGYLYRSILEDGADYVEIYQCRCDHIDWHLGKIERRLARQESESCIRVSYV